MANQPTSIEIEKRVLPENKPRGLRFGVPSPIPAWPNSGYIYVCQPTDVFVYDGDRLGNYFFYRKYGTKNVPYVPSRDNQSPNPYNVIYRNYSYPKIHLRGVLIGSDVSGGGIMCPTVSTNQTYLYDASPGAGIPYLPITQQMRNHAINKANSKIGDQKSVTVNWANFVGESYDTRRMMADRINRLIKTVRYLRKAKYEKAYYELFGYEGVGYYDPNWKSWKYKGKRDRRKAGDLWLEWTYGWDLLAQDVYDAVADMRKKPSPLILSARGHAEDQVTELVNTSATAQVTNLASVNVPYILKAKKYSKFSISVRYEVLNTILSDLNGAGIINPAELAWELTPFSFVADWFVNVGAWLRNASIGTGLKFLYGTETTVQRIEAVTTSKWVPFDHRVPGNHKVAGMAMVERNFASADVKRTVLSQPPVMTLSINHHVASVSRIISGAALLQQLLEGLGRGRN